MNVDQRQQKAINDLRRNKVGLRYGTVVADPEGAGRLCVNLGNSDEILVDCKSVGGASVAVGDRVPVLVRGNDILVLGGVGDGAGGGGGGPFQPLDADLTTLAGMPTGLASSIVGMSPPAQDILDANSPADVRAVAKDTSYTPVITVAGHSINYTGSTNVTRGIAHRLGTIMSTDIQMMAVASSILSINNAGYGTGGGGWDQIFRRTNGIPGTTSTGGIGAPVRGPTLLFDGVNDIGAMQQTTGASSGAMDVTDFEVFQHSLRSVISRFRASNLFEEDDGVTKPATVSAVDYNKRTSGSPVITNVLSFSGVTPGQWITGTGIPAATKVLSVDLENDTLTMTANASSGSATATAITLTTVAYDTAYTRSGATPSDTAAMDASNGFYGSTTTVNNKVSIAVPSRYNGGTATLAFLVDDTGAGAVWTIALDGDTLGTLDTRDQNTILNGPTPFWNTCVYRVPLTAGAHTITATPTTIGGGNVAYFDCWWLEADDPSPVCLPLQYHALYAYNDDDIDTLNQAISDVVAEFDDQVFTIETTDLMSDGNDDPDPDKFNDAIHPNDRGHALIAARVADSFASRARAQAQHSRGAYNFPFLTRHPTDSTRNILQPDLPNVTPLTLRAANYPVTQSADLLDIQDIDGNNLVRFLATGGITATGALNVGTTAVFSNFGGGAFINTTRDNLVRIGYKSGTLGDYASGISFAQNSNLYETGADELTIDGDLIIGGSLTAGSLGSGNPTTFQDFSHINASPDTSSGTGSGDKIALHSAGYGIGVGIGSVVIYTLPGGGSVQIKEADGTGAKYDGTTFATLYCGEFRVADGSNHVLGTSSGTKIGTGTSQKLGFYNATPIVQPSSTTDLRTALINLGLYATGGASPLDLNGGAFTAGSISTAAATITIANLSSALNTTSYIAMTEMSAPSTPGANIFRIFARDSGAGKTQVVAKFESGNTVVIAEDF